MSRCCSVTRLPEIDPDRRPRSRVEVRGPGGVKTHIRRLSHWRRRRAQYRAQAERYRVRGLHVAGALHRVDDAVRFRSERMDCATAAISPTRTNGAIASRCPPTDRRACGARCFRPSPEQSEADINERCRRAGAHANILPGVRSPTTSCIAISMSPTSASRRLSAKGACCWPATPPTSTIRSAAWA